MVTKTFGYLEVLTSTDLNNTFAECATLVGSETLTNKTLTDPAINGTVTTTGLTMPETGFAAAQATPTANRMVNESIIKSWGAINYDGTIASSYNVSSIDRYATGKFRVYFNTDFSSGNFSAVVSIYSGGFQGVAKIGARAAGYIDVYTFDAAGNFANIPFNFIAIGAQ